jgi:hypothetical protein
MEAPGDGPRPAFNHPRGMTDIRDEQEGARHPIEAIEHEVEHRDVSACVATKVTQ